MSVNLTEISAPTRRQTFINVQSIFESDAKMKEVAGQNALLDATLYLLACNDAELMQRLEKFISVDELKADAAHVSKGYHIRRKMKERRAIYEGVHRPGINPVSTF